MKYLPSKEGGAASSGFSGQLLCPGLILDHALLAGVTIPQKKRASFAWPICDGISGTLSAPRLEDKR